MKRFTKDGEVKITTQSKILDQSKYWFNSPFEDGKSTNPEEFIGTALVGCYSMYLSLLLTEERLNLESIDTKALITIARDDSGPNITEINLDVKVKCQGIDESKLKRLAATTKEKWPASRSYTGGTAKISIEAQLIK